MLHRPKSGFGLPMDKWQVSGDAKPAASAGKGAQSRQAARRVLHHALPQLALRVTTG